MEAHFHQLVCDMFKKTDRVGFVVSGNRDFSGDDIDVQKPMQIVDVCCGHIPDPVIFHDHHLKASISILHLHPRLIMIVKIIRHTILFEINRREQKMHAFAAGNVGKIIQTVLLKYIQVLELHFLIGIGIRNFENVIQTPKLRFSVVDIE